MPISRRKRLGAVAAIWFGFPMILTNAVFGGIITYHLGVGAALGAILVGNAVLAAYVGALSAIAGRTGFNFALQARRTFGAKIRRPLEAIWAYFRATNAQLPTDEVAVEGDANRGGHWAGLFYHADQTGHRRRVERGGFGRPFRGAAFREGAGPAPGEEREGRTGSPPACLAARP